ncbi:MAG: helix-turn-helix domain-containing protein [Candidatus Bathyarchaeia archaeon]
MIEATLSLEPPHSWVKSLMAKYPASIRIIDCKAVPGGGGVQELFEVTAPANLSRGIVSHLRRDSYVYDVEVISSKSGRIHGSLRTRKCTACRSFADSACFLSSAMSQPDGSIEWVVLGKEDSLKQLFKKLEADSVKFKVTKLSKLESREALTARQESILQIALEKGYFSFPRKTSLRQLSSLLDMSAASLSEVLRRGERSILEGYFKGRTSTLSRQSRL